MRRELTPGDRRLWLLRAVALRIEQQAVPVWRVEVYHRRLLVGLAALALAGWLAAATGLFLWLNRQPHNQVGWFDLAAPWRWSGLRTKRGDTAVLTALDELKARDYTSAFYNLRVGLARSPGNVDGRLVLARLLAGHDPARALETLEEGLPHAPGDPKLIGALMAFYGAYQMHTRGLEVAEGLLRDATRPLSTETRLVLDRARVGFLLQLGRTAEADTAFAAIKPGDAAGQAQLAGLQVELLLRLGRPAEAKVISDRMVADPHADITAWRQAADVGVALGDAEAVQSAIRRLKAASPETPGAYLFAYQAWHRMKRPSLRDAAEQEYYRLFRTSDGALQAFAALAVTLDLPDVVARAERVARSARLSPFAFQVHLTELALRHGEVEEATRLLRAWENNVDTLKAAQRFHPEFIKRLTRAAFSGTPDQSTFLAAHLSTARGMAQIPVYQLAASVLEKAGNPTGAAEVVKTGLQFYPQSDPLLAAQSRLAGLAAARQKAAEAAATQSPAIVLLPATGTEAVRQLDELLQKDSLVAARDLARAIRAQKPAWLSTIDAALAAREVELGYLTLDQIASRSLIRAYVDRRRAEADLLELVPVVQHLADRGQAGAARLLADEVKAAPGATARVQSALQALKLVDESAPALAGQAATLAALDGHILAQQWAQAERLLKGLQDSPPAWLGGAATDVKVREVQVRLGLDQRPLAMAALKELVIKAGASRSAAFKLVRDLLARGESEPALLLAREIGRLLPGDRAAAGLLREAETPQPTTP